MGLKNHKGIFFFILVFLYFVWLMATPTLADPDAFYHIKISQLIAERGLITSFPWLWFTTLKDNFTDHHLFFHLLMTPFVIFGNGVIGAKFLAVLLAAGFVSLSVWLMRRLGVKWPELFSLLMLLNASFVFRLSLVKAIPLSLIIFFLGLYLMFRHQTRGLFLASAIFVWAYGGWPITIVAAITHAGVSSLINVAARFKTGWWKALKLFIREIFRREQLNILAAVFGGSLIGLVINPYFPQNLYFYWQQVVQIGLFNLNETIAVGAEWYPLSIFDFLGGSSLIFIFLVIAIVWGVIYWRRVPRPAMTMLILTALFFVMTLKSNRYIEYFVPAAAWFIALTLSATVTKRHFLMIKEKIVWLWSKHHFWAAVLTAYFILATPFILIRDVWAVKSRLSERFHWSYLAGASTWLKENLTASPGSELAIVLHASWDEFPFLFFHNDQQYYIVGLDATFMYNYDRDLYWLHQDFAQGKIKADLYDVVTNRFNARAVLVGAAYTAAKEKLLADQNFTLVYEDDEASVFLPTRK